jgi:hypothetical protein
MKKKTGPNGAWTLCEVQAKYDLNHDLNRIDTRDIGEEGQQSGVIVNLLNIPNYAQISR